MFSVRSGIVLRRNYAAFAVSPGGVSLGAEEFFFDQFLLPFFFLSLLVYQFVVLLQLPFDLFEHFPQFDAESFAEDFFALNIFSRFSMAVSNSFISFCPVC